MRPRWWSFSGPGVRSVRLKTEVLEFGQVSSVYCDERKIYCGQENQVSLLPLLLLLLQVVGVHLLATGAWERDLPCGAVAFTGYRIPEATGLLVAGEGEVLLLYLLLLLS